MYLKKILLLVFLIIFIFVPSFFFLLELRRVSAGGGISAYDGDYKAGCAVVLTGGAGRVREGFDLLSQGAVRKLVISGVHSEVSMSDIFPQKFFDGSFSTKDIVLEKQSKSTYENAEYTLRLVQKLKCKDILLITSHLHIYRAERVFRKIFPPGYRINTVAVPPASLSVESYVVEALKSLFYSLWAY